jgi:hypothetical protein
VRLAADAAKIAELHLGFAERRLDEISGLIDEGRYGDIDRATQEFEYHVQQALIAMQTVAAGDPLRAQALAVRVTPRSQNTPDLYHYDDECSRNPRIMQRAIDTSQSAGGMTPGEFSENENEVINENINDDPGNTNGYDQSNQNSGIGNENENDNDDGNTNLNSNENDDRNDNQNNQNDDDDQNSNSNQNDEDDDNQNESGNDNDNGSGGGNENDNDDDDSDDNDGNDDSDDNGGND